MWHIATNKTRFPAYACYFSGLAFLWRLLNGMLGRVPILMYHSIQGENGVAPVSCLAMRNMVVRRDIFEKHLEYLVRHHSVIGMDDLADYLKGAKRLPRHPVVLTFDDGFRDNYTEAFPALKKYGLTATFFIIGAALAGEKAIWPHMLYRFIDHFSGKPFALAAEEGTDFQTSALNRSEKQYVLDVLRVKLRDLEQGERMKILERVGERNGTTLDMVSIESEYMTADEIEELRRCGHLIGFHTVSHENLGTLSPERQKEEILDAGDCSSGFSQPGFAVFSYPFGVKDSFGQVTKNLLRSNGFACAVSTLGGLNGRGVDLFALRRIEMRNFDGIEFSVQLSGVMGDFKNLAKRLLGK